MERSYLTFMVGQTAYGIPEGTLRMFLCDKMLAPKPQNTSAAVAGTYAFDGEQFLIMSLRALFGLPAQPGELVTLVGLKHPKGGYGFVVDTLDDTFSFGCQVMDRAPEEAVVTAPRTALPYVQTVVTGLAQGAQKHVYVLDLELLFAPETLMVN